MMAKKMPEADEVVVVDADVEVPEILLEGLSRPATVVRLQRNTNPLEQLESALFGLTGLAAIHFVCHGSAGALRLAGWRIDGTMLAAVSGAMARIGCCLSPDGRIALWSGNVASGKAGRDFVDLLERAFGHAVSASSQPIGRGMPWALDCGSPLDPPISDRAVASYPYALLGLGST